MPQRMYTPDVYGGRAELPESRDPYELPTPDSDYLPQMPANDASISGQNLPMTVETPAWQRHQYPPPAPTDPPYTMYTPQSSTRALTPIDTSVEMVRVSPSNASSQFVSPNNDCGHQYRTSAGYGAMLSSPRATITPSSSDTSHVSPTQFTASHGIPLNHIGHGTQPNDTAGNSQGSRLSPFHDYSTTSPFGEHSFNHFEASVSPMPRHGAFFAQEYNMSQAAMLATPVPSPPHPSQLPSAFVRHPYIFNAQHYADAPRQRTDVEQSGPVRFDTESDTSRRVRAARSTSERYINEAPLHPFSDPPIAGYMAHPTIYHSSLHADEILPTYEESRMLPMSFTNQEVQEIPPPVPSIRGLRRATATFARALGRLIPPLPCVHCGREFNGRYQKANRDRHVKSFHAEPDITAVGIVDDGRNCRKCGKLFRRPDARRKHEWKKHRIEDCRPNKRRIEKRGGERRIYMPPMPDEAEDTW